MGLIKFTHRGHTDAMVNLFKNALKKNYLKKLDKYGKKGVKALRLATPRETGKTAESWEYKIEETDSGAKLIWYNTNENKGENIAILIQYGHGTTNGGFVRGRDYINPALRPVVDEMFDEIWKGVTGKT